jgi:hypothetical protein
MPSAHGDIGMQVLDLEQIDQVAGASAPVVELPTGPLPYNPFPDILNN